MKNLPLTDFAEGKTVVVLKIDESEYILNRYLSLGIYEGVLLRIMIKSGRNIVARVGNAKIAFTGSSASNMICREESDGVINENSSSRKCKLRKNNAI